MEIEVKIEMPEGFHASDENMDRLRKEVEERFNERMSVWLEIETNRMIVELMEGTSKIKNPTGIINTDDSPMGIMLRNE